MSFYDEYKQKLRTPEEAVACVNSGDWVDYGMLGATPDTLDRALAARIEEVSLTELNFLGAMVPRRPAVFDVSDPAAHLTWNSWFMSGFERAEQKNDFLIHCPMRYSELPRYYRSGRRHANVVMLTVAPMDEHGYFNFGPAASHLAAVIEGADTVLLEINENTPVCLGGYDNAVHISDVSGIVETDSPPYPVIPPAAPDDTDRQIARYLVDAIHDGSCLQLGIGGMPNAVGALLKETDLKNLGVHSEMLAESFVDLAEAGMITGRRKQRDPGRMTYAFAAGTKRLYDFIHNNPACMSAPVDYVNDARVIADIDNFVSVNNAVDIDLYGQVEAESSGFKHISGAGGQQDFMLGAYLSKGGKSFICLSSTFTDRAGELQSRIRPVLQPGSNVTDTRVNTQYIVTEYGMADLKGATGWERAEALIGLAHPSFREGLIADAQKMGIWRRSNKRG